MFSNDPLALIVVGPTASGKTNLSLKLAEFFNTSIISADSRQCFREMNIGTAKPSVSELAFAPHFFINSHSIQEHVDAAVFEQYAIEKISHVFMEHKICIITGGTGLYVKSFCEGLDDMPAIDPSIRELVNNEYISKGVAYLQQWLSELDPLFLKKSSETNNPSRLMRAIEMKLQTGQSILDFRKGSSKKRSFRVAKIGIEWPKELLYERINHRVDMMMEQGLLQEVESLIPFKNNPALQTVGYQELFDYLEGKVSLSFAIEKIKQHTRNYAKRQMTWFRKDLDIHWFSHQNLDAVIPICANIHLEFETH